MYDDDGEPLTKEDVDGCMKSFAWGCLGLAVFIGILGYALGVW